MKQTRFLMGMPISIEIADPHATEKIFDDVFDYFVHIDEKFSTYKSTSEITAINTRQLKEDDWSPEMKLVFTLSDETRRETGGFFDIKKPDGTYDPSGIVKGWAIWNASQLILKNGFKDFYVDAGGDIQPHGANAEGEAWSVGIKNPWPAPLFDKSGVVQGAGNEIIKIIRIGGRGKSAEGVATSGTYIRGLHIYNPRTGKPADEITSLTVIGPNIYEADRFATAAFAMGKDATNFIERLPGFEGYIIDNNKVATMTSGFEKYTI